MLITDSNVGIDDMPKKGLDDMVKRLRERVNTIGRKSRAAHLALVGVCLIVSGCVSSTATMKDDVITVKSEALSLFYSHDRLIERSQKYALDVCINEKGNGIKPFEENKDVQNSGQTASVIDDLFEDASVESSLVMGFFDMIPTYSVTRQWTCIKS